MKKLLACVLALALFLSCAVSAIAVNDEIDTQSLLFELPVVTGIEVEWNGEILLSYWLNPRFTPDNVKVTVSFEEGEPEELVHWHDSGNGWWWQISHEFDSETGIVTFIYEDSRLRTAFYDELGGECCCDIGEDAWDVAWQVYYKSLPQDSFVFPVNYLEQHIDGFRPLTELELDKVVTTSGYNVYQFIPTKSGAHNFVFEAPGWNQYRIRILNANLERITSDWVYGNFIRNLLAGETYYIIISSYYEMEYKFVVTDDVTQGGGSWCDWCDDWGCNECGYCYECGEWWEDCDCGHYWQPNWWQRIQNWFWNIPLVWQIEDLIWRMNQNLLGRIILTPLLSMFLIVAVPIVFPILIYEWIVTGYF